MNLAQIVSITKEKNAADIRLLLDMKVLTPSLNPCTLNGAENGDIKMATRQERKMNKLFRVGVEVEIGKVINYPWSNSEREKILQMAKNLIQGNKK